jgi:hypothetical protein
MTSGHQSLVIATSPPPPAVAVCWRPSADAILFWSPTATFTHLTACDKRLPAAPAVAVVLIFSRARCFGCCCHVDDVNWTASVCPSFVLFLLFAICLSADIAPSFTDQTLSCIRKQAAIDRPLFVCRCTAHTRRPPPWRQYRHRIASLLGRTSLLPPCRTPGHQPIICFRQKNLPGGDGSRRRRRRHQPDPPTCSKFTGGGCIEAMLAAVEYSMSVERLMRHAE